MQTNGIHHVTAIAGTPTANVAFYTDVLGVRLVKQTVNFDDTHTYHLYYGDETGTPGTILTFFPFAGEHPGRPGRGQATATAFTIPDGSVDYWEDRLRAHDVEVDDRTTRFGETVLSFRDHDGQPLELVTGDSPVEPWTGGPVPSDHAIRGFHGVTLHSTDPEVTGSILGVLGYEQTASTKERLRYTTNGDRASVIDILTSDGPRGRPGVGTVHHVAFRTADDDEQSAWRERLTEAGMYVTKQKDRRYFRSIYFREPGGVLFEIATDEPGFTRDEDPTALGTELKLPPWLEADRDVIEDRLPPLDVAAEADV
ncbi:ring-cleaving dioxygenase [Haloferax profundi]|uniref:Diguanylate cyclase n=1 Tax=Haloferax profundi TaxID=1544718 RepID=A0A0W1SLB6_9EURY|nr:ring-cleaving dioxygenase [Haloferax profundi]KTG27037.1 diguanylate cyclase [Haloferax profundi]